MVLQDLSHFTQDQPSFIDGTNVVLSSIQIEGVDQTEKNRIARVIRRIILDNDIRNVEAKDINFILQLLTGRFRENIISRIAHRRCLRDREDCLDQAEHIIDQIQAKLRLVLVMTNPLPTEEDEESINKLERRTYALIGGGSITVSPVKHLNGSGVFHVQLELPEETISRNGLGNSREFGCGNYRIFTDADGSRVLCIYDNDSPSIQHAYYIEENKSGR